MKKNKLFLGMLAAALTFGLILTGCPTDSGDSKSAEAEITSVAEVAVSTATGGDGATATRPPSTLSPCLTLKTAS
jgi:pectin methylesterase-like acyl-CoA thioesterase